jgi:DNA-binding CsgD family transcriptional regulator
MSELDQLTRLIARVPEDDFGAEALAVISRVARIENFGAYTITDLRQPQPVLSFWSGKISDYWFQRQAEVLLETPEAYQHILDEIAGTGQAQPTIERWHPSRDDPRWTIYRSNRIVERISVSSRDGHTGLRSFFLRSEQDGWLSEAAFEGLKTLLPAIHHLIALRQQIVGTKGRPLVRGGRVSVLRARNVPDFAALSPREAQVCDLLIGGKTVAGTALELRVAETTVRTLRARSYRKLRVGSANELMALLIDQRG